ncbi:MAG: SDR family oxidoreductase, partial [Anaerolineaceae bacterium]
MDLLKEKVAIVTGAGSGIGRACALFYARDGARVVVSDVDITGGDETVDLIRQAGGEAYFIRADVSKPGDCARLVEETVKQYGRLDYACNNAGIGGESNLTGEYSVEGWQKVIEINLSGVFYCMRYQIPEMLRTGGGSIVNMTSILGQVGFKAAPAYVAAKHGVVGLTRNAALEYADQGIRVNAIGPAFIHTPLISSLEENEQALNGLIALHPIGRLGKP